MANDQNGAQVYQPFRLLSNTAETTVELQAVRQEVNKARETPMVDVTDDKGEEAPGKGSPRTNTRLGTQSAFVSGQQTPANRRVVVDEVSGAEEEEKDRDTTGQRQATSAANTTKNNTNAISM